MGAAASASGAAAARQLAAELARLASGYSFVSTVIVDGKVATRARGRWSGGSSEFVVTSGGASVTYRAVPPRAWTLTGGRWVEVVAPAAAADPLDALRAPSAASVVSDGPTGTVIQATYPASALGLKAGTSVQVALAIGPDGTLTARSTPDPGTSGTATETVFTPSSGQAPIAAPSAGG